MGTISTDSHIVEGQIITCPNCGQRNRIHKQQGKVSFRCGACKKVLPSQFDSGSSIAGGVSSPKRKFDFSKYRILIGLFAVLVLAVILFIFLPSKNPTRGLPNNVRAQPSPSLTHGKPTQDLPRYEQVQPNQSLPAKNPTQISPRENQFQSIKPEVPLAPPRRLGNGTLIDRPSRSGNGTFIIENGTGHDAVIKIIDEKAKMAIVTFYVCMGQKASFEHIPDGSFRVIFASGIDWDSTAGTFTREKSFAKFDGEFDFTTSQHTEGDKIHSQYDVITLTLHKVVNGNATTTNVREEEFLKY